MVKIANIVFSPEVHLYGGAALIMLLFWIGKLRISRFLSVCLLLYTIFIFLTPLPEYFLSKLEDTYPELQVENLDTTQSYHILVLGAGLIQSPGMLPVHQLNRALSTRFLEGLRIYQQLPKALIIGSGIDFSAKSSQGKMVAEAAVNLQVPAKDTAYLSKARNTREEAAYYYERFGNSTPLILVTSANHLPRATRWFEMEGITVIPAPADFRIKRDKEGMVRWRFDWSWNRLNYWHDCLHEWAGKVQQRMVKK